MTYWLGVIGCWIFSDGWYSLALYHDKGEPFIKCHSIRIIRMALGIILIVIGAVS